MSIKFNISFQDRYVLTVEDSLVQAKRIKRFFEENDIPSRICKNGAEALEEAKKEKPVIIISDIVMPVMDGYEFCSRVKADPELSDIPVILLTSLSDPLDIVKGLQAGADNFITKPYDDDYLLTRINYLIANRHIRRMGSTDMSIEIVFQNQKFKINSDKKQILDLLLSVYEAAVNRNEHLQQARRELEEMNENLQAANKELEAFSHTVSHDLKSPLNGVLGFATLLNDDFGELLGEEGNSYLGHIINSAHNMVNLIEDLLAFSQSGRGPVNVQKVNLSEMAGSVLEDLLQVDYAGKYSVSVQDDLETKADPALMRVVLNNLMSNALKYSRQNEEPRVEFGVKEMNGKAVYFVSDNGVGFDMDKADDLFRPFIRLHTNEEFQGTGVGLSTVKRIIDRHGGAIWFESAPGKGTTFFFSVD